jgi:hypothetical protein
MKRIKKGILGMGILSVAAIGIAIPAYKKVDINDLKVSGQESSIVCAADNNVLALGDDTDTVETPTEAVENTEGESKYKYMEIFPDTFEPTSTWSEAMNGYYTAKPEDYEDEYLRGLAEQYVNDGYFLTDKAFIKNTIGEGSGFGDYGFVVGFQVVDSKDGDNTFCTEVVKATQEEFDLFVEDFFESGEEYEKKEEGNVTEIDYSCYKLIYDSEKEILIYETDLTGESVG